jgi:hypothetical protein
MSSAAEAEIGAVFINANEGAVLRTTLEELGNKQPPHQWKLKIPLPQGTATGQLNKNVQRQWICAFIGSKIGGYQNLADYSTKHDSPAHHKRIRNVYINADDQPINQEGIRDSALRGCVNTSGKAGAKIPQLPLGDDSPPWGI